MYKIIACIERATVLRGNIKCVAQSIKQAIARVQHWGPGAKMTEVEVHVCVGLVCASTDDGRPLIGGTNLVSTVGRPFQVADHA